MASALDSHARRRLAELGLATIVPKHGLQVLGQLLSGEHAQVGILPITWDTWQARLGSAFPLLRDVLQTESAPEPSAAATQPELLQQLAAVAAEARPGLLLTYVQGEVARVLGLDASHLPDIQTGFSDMGMDSLMAVDLKNRLQSSIGKPLTSTVTFNYPTIEALARYLSEEVFALTIPAQLQQNTAAEQEKFATTIAEIKQLSEDELIAKIAERFEKR